MVSVKKDLANSFTFTIYRRIGTYDNSLRKKSCLNYSVKKVYLYGAVVLIYGSPQNDPKSWLAPFSLTVSYLTLSKGF